MFGLSDPDDYQPFGYLGRIPLYFTTLLVIVYSVAMVAVALLTAGQYGGLIDYLTFDSALVLERFQFWRFLTYPLLNGPSIWFAIEMYMLYAFGRETERFLGRRSFMVLYATLVFLAPCLLTAAGTWLPSHMAGASNINFGVFIAFVAIYPNVEIFFSIRAKWIALVLVGIFTLQTVAARDLVQLALFLATCATAWFFVKYLRGQVSFRFSWRNYLRHRHSRRNLRAVPSPRRIAGARTLPDRNDKDEDDVIESIDPLLDKIAKSGLASLTAKEKERLESARAALLKKPGR